MLKRILILFSIIMAGICMVIFSIDNISTENILYDAAVCQRSYRLKISDVRGTIYDCRNIPLVNKGRKLVASVVPCAKSLNKLSDAVPEPMRQGLFDSFSSGTPFAIEVTRKINGPDIETFELPVRYNGITLSPHMLGYLSGNKIGASGIEKAYDSYLAGENSEICVRYNVDASNRILIGGRGLVENKSYLMTKGVVLNIDKRIQLLVEQIANKYISKGAVIVTEVPGCEIRASASLPSFMPQAISDYLNDSNSPLLNRVLCQYNLGSIFKLVTAAAALENGICEDFEYDCSGTNTMGDSPFRCFNGKAHGKLNMDEAIAQSCNGYFIELAKHIGAQKLYELSEKFMLGKQIGLAPEMKSYSGILPNIESLENPGALANFSFGQGKLMATPVQVCGIINTIASGGIYSYPKLVKGLVDENMNLTLQDVQYPSHNIISKSTADKLKSYMLSSIERGTSSRGKPEKISAGAKTSTAETGIIAGNNNVVQAWYSGFFPLEDPKYCIVILSEGGRGGGESCGPVFREIADRMYTEIPELFIH